MMADAPNAATVRRVLDLYFASSRQLVSDPKSSIYFSPNTREENKLAVCTALHIEAEALTEKYLGLPSHVGVDSSDCFQHLVDRVCKIISGWNMKNLSIGGKEILLKAVAQAIPSYAMSVFKLPKGICKAIAAAIARYWWGEKDGKKAMHWYSWWKMCTPKKQGGMGFRDLHCFNLAMLAKQIWRLVEAPDSLCAQILRAKYYPSGDLLHAELKKGASFTWQSLMAGMNTFKRGYIWRIGTGSDINIWQDPWLPNSPNGRVLTRRNNVIIDKVEDLIDPGTGSWDEQLLHDIFYPIDARRIQAIPLSPLAEEDSIAWLGTKNGMFSVKSAYHME
jgi:hypothetical protein